MMIKEFNSLEEIEKYYDKNTNTYVFKENNELFDTNGYCSLRKAKECINYLFKVKSYKFIKGERRKPLKEYDLIGKYIILVKGHYVAQWNNTYFSTFNNDNDKVVALWELEVAEDE